MKCTNYVSFNFIFFFFFFLETNELEIERSCTFAKQNNNNACQTKLNKLTHAKKYKDMHCNTCEKDECNDDSLPTTTSGPNNAAAPSAVTSNCHLMLMYIIALFSLRRICNWNLYSVNFQSFIYYYLVIFSFLKYLYIF